MTHDPFLDDEIRRRNTKSIADHVDTQVMKKAKSYTAVAFDFHGAMEQLTDKPYEELVVGLLTEIRDTLQGRRGMIALPSAEEVKRYGQSD